MEDPVVAREKQRTSLWAGDLPSSITVHILFLTFGAEPGLLSIVQGKPPQNDLYRDKSFFFINFSSHECAERFLLKYVNASVMESKWKLRWSRPSVPHYPGQEFGIYVSGLARDTTEKDIYQAFFQYFDSSLLSVQICESTRKRSKNSKYAFVRFSNPVDRDYCVRELQGIVIKGRPVKINFDEREQERRRSEKYDSSTALPQYLVPVSQSTQECNNNDWTAYWNAYYWASVYTNNQEGPSLNSPSQ